MSIFKKKRGSFVTAGLKVWAQTYLGVKFWYKNTLIYRCGVFFFLMFFFVLFFVVFFYFLFVCLFVFLFCFVLFFAWKNKMCLVITFTSDVHAYTITSKCPHPRIAEREMIFPGQ